MLPGGLDPLYRRILSTGGEHFVRVEVWSKTGGRIAVLNPSDRSDDGRDIDQGGLIYLSGSTITASLMSAVSRNLTLNVPWRLYPVKENDLLNPYGREIRIWRGVLLAGRPQPYTWQVFRGKIQDVGRDQANGYCTVACSDLAQDVLDAGFVRPQNSTPGLPLNLEFQRLVRGALPEAEFGPSDDFAEETQALAWEFARGSAIEEMFSSVGALWYALPDGRFITRRYPWAVPGSPIITLTDGDGGVILSAGERRSRREMFNSVTATGERLNGDAPVHGVAQDNRPGSVTSIDGDFGIKSKLIRRQTPSTQGGAQATAEAALRTGITPTELVSWVQVPDPAMELGDVAGLDISGRKGLIQVVSSFTMPVDIGPAMTVQGRSQVIGQVQAGGGF
jgi:hypothetical protein